jgi:hypothetical protein
MSARLAGLAIATAALCGCHDAPRDAAPAPPITAARPADPEPATPEPAAPTAPPPKAAPLTSARTAPPPSPAPASDTPAPGAIPPAPAPDASAKAADKPVDPLQWLQDSQARQADYKRRLADGEAAVAASDAAAATWEKNLLAFKNPFLPRPVLAPDDATAIQGMDGAQRVHWAEGKLAEARAARDDAKKALDDLKANPPLN